MPSANLQAPVSAISGVQWPGFPTPDGAALLVLQYQFEQSQWWPLPRLEAHQFRQLRELISHAARSVPFYRGRIEAAGIDPADPHDPATADLDPAGFARMPLLTRRDIQTHGEALMSRSLPPDHGRLVEHKSSGTTGEPIRVFGTELDSLFWRAYTLRDHLWHRRDLRGKLCIIRGRIADGEHPGWGPATDAVFATGPSANLNIRADPERQIEWLRKHDGDYLLTQPTNARELARLCLARGVALPRLKEVRTFGEVVTRELRELCRDAWGVGVVDTYSANEVGYIALQCPEYADRYHVQSEHLLVEVLDSAGRPCAPGESGLVVITTLHNFAMPLIRYVPGDYAQAGAACPCGRGLPVLTRVHGRQRNMLMLPDGSRHWPSSPRSPYGGVVRVQQLQLVQHALDRIEARFVSERALGADEHGIMVAAIQDVLGYPFTVTLTRVDEIPPTASMKHEDFVSHIAAAASPVEPTD